MTTDEPIPSECKGLLFQPQYKGHKSSHLHFHVSVEKHSVRFGLNVVGMGGRPDFFSYTSRHRSQSGFQADTSHMIPKMIFISILHDILFIVVGPSLIHDGCVLGIRKEPIGIVQQVTLVMTTTPLATFPLMRTPFQSLTAIVTHLKRHPHTFLAIATEIVFIGVEGIEEEAIFPLGDFFVQCQHQGFHTSLKLVGVPNFTGRLILALSLRLISMA